MNINHDPKNGEFSEGSSASALASAYQFYSPNEQENLHFDEAAKRLNSENQKRFIEISKDVDRQVGLAATPKGAIGDWADGAENSVLNEIRGKASTRWLTPPPSRATSPIRKRSSRLCGIRKDPTRSTAWTCPAS
jgi:hypothetical protein